jgi:hypothetical protein
VSESTSGRRFKGRRGQRAAQVRLVEPDDQQAGRQRITTDPIEFKFVCRGKDNQRVRTGTPIRDDIRVGDRETERSVHCLAHLDTGRKIRAGHHVQAGCELPMV